MDSKTKTWLKSYIPQILSVVTVLTIVNYLSFSFVLQTGNMSEWEETSKVVFAVLFVWVLFLSPLITSSIRLVINKDN